jgi:mRNA interferase RelE/StbE
LAPRYRVQILPGAARELAALPHDVRQRIDARIQSLADNPRPPGVEKLAGEEGLYRVRAGDFRVVYSIQDDVLLVLVVRIGHRGEVYRSLRKRRGK